MTHWQAPTPDQRKHGIVAILCERESIAGSVQKVDRHYIYTLERLQRRATYYTDMPVMPPFWAIARVLVYRVYLTDRSFCFVAYNGYIIESAPCIAWAVGQAENDVIAYFEKKGRVDNMSENQPVTRVVNKYKEAYDVYIGRGSKWGNPFKRDVHGTKEEVIAMYEDYIRAKPELLACLDELEGKRLGCFCKPKACHGDVLLKLLEEKKAGRL